MPPLLPFIKSIQGWDADLYRITAELQQTAMQPGALDSRTKMLISLACDAALGSRHGVASVAAALRQMGVSDGEIAEALRLAYFCAGNSVLSACGAAFEKHEVGG